MRKPGSTTFQMAFWRNRAVLHIAAAGLILVAATATFLTLSHLRQEAEMQVASATQNLTQSVDQTFEGIIDTIDVALLASAEEISRQLAAGKVNADATTRFLVRQKELLPHVGFLRATDEHGLVLFGPGIPNPPANNADREFFIALRDGATNALYVARPLLGKVVKKWLWPFARRIEKPDGSFGGVVFASIYIDEIERMLAQINLAPGSVISLRDADLSLIARSTFDGANPVATGDKRLSTTFRDALRVNPNAGTFISDQTTPDGIIRTYSYRRNAKYGFTVNVGIKREAALDEWYGQLWIATGLLCAFSLLTVSFSLLISGAWRRQDKIIAELESSRQSLNKAQEIAQLGSYVYDLRTDRWSSSQVLDKIFGIGSDYPHDLEHWIDLIATDMRTEMKDYFLNAVVGRQVPFDREYRIVRASDQQERWVHGKGNMQVDSRGNPLVMHGVIQDITDRKRMEEALQESEARFRRMFESNDSVMLLIEPGSGEIVDANAAAVRYYGYTAEQLKAMRIDQINILAPEEVAEKRVAAASGSNNIFVFPHRLATGEVRTVEVRSSAIEVGSQVLLFSIINDITERELALADLKRSNAELEQFSYAISHDMRQPLRMISSYLQLLGMELAEQLDGEKREFFNFAIDGAKRLDRMLLALLEFSRVGRIGEPPAWVEGRAILDDVLQILQPAIEEAQAKLVIAGEWPKVFVSRDEVLRMLQNLIDNALKFRVAGRTPEITITSSIDAAVWHTSVADNGVGIIPSQIGRLFQVFQRLQPRTAYDGTGVGLALCRKIAEHHHGRIWAESPGEGQGSTFHLELPIGTP